MDELRKHTQMMIDMQSKFDREDAQRLKGYRLQLDTLLKGLVVSTPSQTPVRDKKKAKRISEDDSTASSSSVDASISKTSGRPLRSAAEKAKLELKERSVVTKLRQGVTVKVERMPSIEAVIVKTKENDLNVINMKTEKLSIASPYVGKSNEHDAGSKKTDESVIIVPQIEDALVILSDDDADDELVMMPPPRAAPRKKIAKTNDSTSFCSVSEKSELIEGTTSQRPVRKTRGNKPKKGVLQPMFVAKSEKNPITDVDVEVTASAKANGTLESVYEDAVTDQAHSDEATASSATEHNSEIPTNSTYIQPKGSYDATFVAQIPAYGGGNQTITVQPAGDATFVAQPATSGDRTVNANAVNATFYVPTPPPTALNNIQTAVTLKQESETKLKTQTSVSSLLTEDESEDDMPLKLVKKKDNRELFNPCVQSPLKKKVEAFERHVQDTQSPAPQRTTRTKTRAIAAAAAEEKVSSVGSAISVAQTKFCTPNQADIKKTGKSIKTPQSLNVVSNLNYNTSNIPLSKLAHINRAVSVSKLPRANSAEDVRRGVMLSSDELKRKREEKHKHVQQSREALEKEKREKVLKQVQEKEDKQRQEAEKKRLAKEKRERDVETKKNVEEMNRKIQKELSIQAEKDRLRIVADKKALQLKLKQNIALANQKPNTIKYSFEMLNTDDETDDESQPKAGRPTPPEWSTRGNREDRIASQSHMSSACIEQMFPVIPMTPDLRELFPEINERHLRRNSSAVWNTPPRYSRMELPKY